MHSSPTSSLSIDHPLPAYTTYPYPHLQLPIQDIWPPDNMEESLRNFTFHRTALTREVTFDMDGAHVDGDDAQIKTDRDVIKDVESPFNQSDSNAMEGNLAIIQENKIKFKEDSNEGEIHGVMNYELKQ